MTAPNPDKLYSIKEAAKLLGIGRTKIYQLLDERQLDHVKIGNRSLIRATSVSSLIERSLQ